MLQGVTKLRIYFQGALYSFMLVGLMHNSTTEKEEKNAKKMSVKVSFVTPGMEKIGRMVVFFLFLPFIHSI